MLDISNKTLLPLLIDFKEHFYKLYKQISCKANLHQVFITPWLPTHKQEFCSPSLRCKTHAFCLPGLRHLDNFIITWQILPIYRDCAKTHATPDPSLRSGQAPTATPHTTGPLAFRPGVSQKNYHSLHYMYRLFDFLYKRILPLYI